MKLSAKNFYFRSHAILNISFIVLSYGFYFSLLSQSMITTYVGWCFFRKKIFEGFAFVMYTFFVGIFQAFLFSIFVYCTQYFFFNYMGDFEKMPIYSIAYLIQLKYQLCAFVFVAFFYGVFRMKEVS